MKLELKHLAPYLPYDLKLIADEGRVLKLDGLRKDVVFANNGPFVYKLDFDEIKPILRPLSDLTKEIEVKNEKFVPIEYLEKYFLYGIEIKENAGHYYIYNSLQEVRINGDLILNPVYGVEDECPFWVYDFLLQWHFDVFGLINKGLGVDFNENKKQ